MAPETSISKVGPGASAGGLALAQIPLGPGKITPRLGCSFSCVILSRPCPFPSLFAIFQCVQTDIFLSKLCSAPLRGCLSTLKACLQDVAHGELGGLTLELGVGSRAF